MYLPVKSDRFSSTRTCTRNIDGWMKTKRSDRFHQARYARWCTRAASTRTRSIHRKEYKKEPEYTRKYNQLYASTAAKKRQQTSPKNEWRFDNEPSPRWYHAHPSRLEERKPAPGCHRTAPEITLQPGRRRRYAVQLSSRAQV